MRFRRIVYLLCGIGIIICFYLINYYIFNNLYKKTSHAAANVKATAQISKPKYSYYIVVVACGQRLQETLVMIKSALLFNYSKELLKFVIFTEENLWSEFNEKLTDWHNLLPQEFQFELKALRFPEHHEKEWKSLFKPCAAQRLFLPSLLNDIDSVLYVDTDILFLSPITDIWSHFINFNSSQLAGLSPEHEVPNIGWYNRFARHPFYGNLGVNSGVMLMNLTLMRQFNWEARVLPIYKEYKLRITWGDQDIINILFYYHPEKLYLFPCEYNYRPDHCMYMNVCNTSRGIKIMHGNRGYFHNNKQPLFSAVYDAVEGYQLLSNTYSNFLVPLKEALDEQILSVSNCGKVASSIIKIPQEIFLNEYNYESN